MSRPTGATAPQNPFSALAIARTDEGSGDFVTVETPAVRVAVRLLDDYLAPAPEESTRRQSREGNLVAIVGDHGTGKTHLAMHLVHRATAAAPPLVVHPFYLEASSNTFETLYRGFVEKLQQEDVLETVRDYYADVVARDLELGGDVPGSQFTRDTIAGLRGRELDPASVVRGLGLTDSRLARQLRQELVTVTRKQQFGVALTLLLRRHEFAQEAWTWLTGGPPSPALIERGITSAISGEQMALEAMGVFAYFYGRRYHRFLLVIDELDRIAEVHRNADRSATAAFRKMFEVFEGAGAFLVIAGVPDLLDTLGTNVRQRIGHVVTMSALDGAAVRRLIERTNYQHFGVSQLAPFAPATPELMAKLADGTARQVIRLCYQSFRRHNEEQAAAITEATVTAVAREQFDFPSLESARTDVRRVLNRHGLSYIRQHWVGAATEPIDFWVTVGSREAGCAILMSRSLISPDDLRAVEQQVRAIRSELPGSETLLVIDGYVHVDLRDQIRATIDSEPLEFIRYSFEDDFAARVKAALGRIEGGQAGTASDRMLERLVWLNQQQSYAQGFAERLVSRMEETRAALEEQLNTIRTELRAGPAPTGEGGRPSAMPSAVAQLFEHALARLSGAVLSLDDLFNPGVSPYDLVDRRTMVRAALRRDELYAAVGVASLLRGLVEAFRDGVEAWFDLRTPFGSGQVRLKPAEEDKLIQLCHTYEAVYENLPVSRLEELPAVPDDGSVYDDVDQVSWATRRSGVRETFDDLGRAVRQAVLQATHPPPRD
ncbi:hypothetical protein O7626_04300 [Micromonospora sp. WMMD1102]|uniref:hypothetical protein n=1 Tax=Micromonospora sp. WMMD1102 TaxID=3016105 RepID=UPI002414D046|nr:hypothetical protein [Micromonospora sp. WMMD1102]MDG4785161.1 hypothetical protein [Micromonospora sp. WMMD1102]